MGTRQTPRRAIRDWTLSLASVCLLILVIMSIDGRVWRYASSARSGSNGALTAAGDQVGSLARAAGSAVEQQAGGHTSLALFALAGAGLVFVMLRVSKW